MHKEGVRPEDNPYHLMCLKGHTDAVRAVAAHGRICISASYDSTVRVWDLVKGKCIHVLKGHVGRVYSIVYDRYRGRCASGSVDNTVRVWDIHTGACIQVLTGHTALVGLLNMSPNYMVSAAVDASLRIWDANSIEYQTTLSTNASSITCFAHDERKIVSGSDGTLRLWDIRTGQPIRDLITGIQSVWQIVFRDNILVAATNRGGNFQFEVFDFGRANHISGVDDESLDALRRPPWERKRQYEDATSDISSERPSLKLALPSRRSGRLAGKSKRIDTGSRRIKGSPFGGNKSGASARKRNTRAASRTLRGRGTSFAPSLDEDEDDEPYDDDDMNDIQLIG